MISGRVLNDMHRAAPGSMRGVMMALAAMPHQLSPSLKLRKMCRRRPALGTSVQCQAPDWLSRFPNRGSSDTRRGAAHRQQQHTCSGHVQ